MDIIIEKLETFNKQEYMAKYYRDNEKHLLEYQNEYRLRTMHCECGCLIKCYNQASHKRSEKHKLLIKQKALQEKLKILESN